MAHPRNNLLSPSLSVSDASDLTFPCRLFLLLKKSEECGMEDVISWTTDGQGFKVHDPTEFEKHLLSQNFKMKKYSSFTRQLCAYGFSCVRKGRQPGLYYHPNFVRSNPDACYQIVRGSGKHYSAAARKLDERHFQNTGSVLLNIPDKLSSTAEQSKSKSPYNFPKTTVLPPVDFPKTTMLPQADVHKPMSNLLSMFDDIKNSAPRKDESEFSRKTKFPSILNYTNNTTANAQVLENMYNNVRNRAAWDVGTESGRISPDSCSRKQIANSSLKSSISGSNLSLIPKNESVVEADFFEPIPLARMENSLEKRIRRMSSSPDQRSSMNDVSMFEPRPIEDMVDQPIRISD
eukprot:scaffold2504_cov94-Cylindrotheca_fusiformis.AAC.2